MFLSIPVIIGTLIWLFYGFSKIISLGPADTVFQLLIISLPAALFSTVFIIFFKRTAKHPSAIVRICSKVLFLIGLALCVYLLTLDIISFIKQPSYNIDTYKCFTLPFLAGNTGGLFLIAIVQAFTTNKEKDWIDRHK